MPELLEIEHYRREAEAVAGRRITSVLAPDAWYLKRGVTASVLTAALTGRHLVAARRRGKLLLLDTAHRRGSTGPVRWCHRPVSGSKR